MHEAQRTANELSKRDTLLVKDTELSAASFTYALKELISKKNIKETPNTKIYLWNWEVYWMKWQKSRKADEIEERMKMKEVPRASKVELEQHLIDFSKNAWGGVVMA